MSLNANNIKFSYVFVCVCVSIPISSSLVVLEYLGNGTSVGDVLFLCCLDVISVIMSCLTMVCEMESGVKFFFLTTR